MNPRQRRKLFRLLDSYAEAHHNSHITEFSLHDECSQVVICFRPLAAPWADRYICRYIEVEIVEANEIIRTGLIPGSVACYLDDQLRPLALVNNGLGIEPNDAEDTADE